MKSLCVKNMSNASALSRYWSLLKHQAFSKPVEVEGARNRKQPTNELAATALSLLGKPGNKEAAPTDIVAERLTVQTPVMAAPSSNALGAIWLDRTAEPIL